MLSYNEIAKQLGIPPSTLRRKVSAFNKVTRECDQIKPDQVEQRANNNRYLFLHSSIAKIQAVLKSVTGKPRGRPVKPKAEAMP